MSFHYPKLLGKTWENVKMMREWKCLMRPKLYIYIYIYIYINGIISVAHIYYLNFYIIISWDLKMIGERKWEKLF
ncbi:MAG: hypothetical protein N7Q72_02745, partial [Spiroplasma sp. Tabriz.8]|nr:hypothetical protein [Spiroplasma sp. Tabriz.8]